jgi:3-hydroxyisobutyrate dehydrogenase-like beta-hydroxyacid dehydrogenase
MSVRVGFAGFGEAGSGIAEGLRKAGLNGITAYDIHTNTPGRGERIRARAAETGTRLAASSAELAENRDVIVSTVTANSAIEAAEQTASHLRAEHIYADLNSVSPAKKAEIAGVIGKTGARFVEAAVMAPVPPYLQKVPMLLNGPAARELAERLSPYGMRFETLDAQFGAAAATKMCRSVIVKGIEALVLESVLASSQYGADERVFASLDESFPGMNWKKLADYVVGRIAVHGERRAHEMEEVARTLEECGVEPMLASATARRMDWSTQFGLRERFGAEGPKTYREVLEAIAEAQAELPKVGTGIARFKD